jgi:hypothetical protein
MDLDRRLDPEIAAALAELPSRARPWSGRTTWSPG